MSDFFQVTLARLVVSAGLLCVMLAAQAADVSPLSPNRSIAVNSLSYEKRTPSASSHHSGAAKARAKKPRGHVAQSNPEPSPPDAQPLSLHEAERLALDNDPLLPHFDALASSFEASAVADAQLPDPELTLGLQDLPVPGVSLTDDDFTQLHASIQQSFPPGQTLRHRGEQAIAKAGAEQARRDEEQRRALREVRNAWLEAYYQTQAAALLRKNQQQLAELGKLTEAQYGAGFGTDQDVLHFQLERSQLQDRLLETAAERDAAWAGLRKWLAPGAGQRPLPAELPELAPLPPQADIAARLDMHPAMQVENALVNAGQSEVDLARDQYQPAWGVEAGYGLRGAGRNDFLSAGVTLSLPIFTDKRQDKRLAASQQQVYAARYSRDDRLRELRQLLDEQYAAWTRLGERLALHKKQLLPESQQNAAAALTGYQSVVTDFSTLFRAYISELEIHLSELRLRVDRAKAQANLLYLAGENP